MTFCRKALISSLIYICLCGNVFPQTVYTTITNGKFKDASTWQNGKKPPDPLKIGDTVKIYNLVDFNDNFDVEGVMIIYSGGDLSGNKKLKINPSGLFINYGILELLTEEFRMDGITYNYGYLYAHKMHIDGYICNSGIMEIQISQKIDLHGGSIDCGGTIICCEVKMHEHDGYIPAISNQNLCCADSTEPYFDIKEGTIDSNSVFFCGILLPIEINDFTATPSNGYVLLRWTAMNESSEVRYAVQRSNDGTDWQTLEWKNARDYTEQSAYESWDNVPNSGPNYYRIAIINPDGNIRYSAIAYVELPPDPTNKPDIRIYAYQSLVHINIAPDYDFNSGQLVIVNAMGGVLYTRQLQPGERELTIPVDTYSGLAIASIRLDDHQVTQKIMLP